MKKLSSDWLQPKTPLQATIARYCDLKSATWHPGTVRKRHYCLLRWAMFLQDRYPQLRTCADLRRHPHVEDWLRSLRQLHPVTRLGYLQVVEQFFREIREWQWPDPPPADLFLRSDVPRLPKRLPSLLDADCDRRLLAVLEAEPSVRNLSLRMLRHTGLRTGELLALPLGAAAPNRDGHWELKVPPCKTYTERLLPLMSQALGCVQAILQRRGLYVPGAKLPDRLIVDEYGQLIPHYTLLRHMKRMAQKAGLPHWQHLHLHQFRHTFASELARAQISLPSLMRLLGHRRPHMTMHYVQLANTDVRHAYEQALLRLPLLSALQHQPLPPSAAASSEPPAQQLRILIASLESQRRDLPPASPHAAGLRRLVRQLQAAARSFRKRP